MSSTGCTPCSDSWANNFTCTPPVPVTSFIAGPPGPSGATGPVGPQGQTGPQGPAGSAANQGATGATGPNGAQGVSGLQGATGASGVGYTGATGPIGATGPVGPASTIGATGPTGPAGVGSTGATGPIGATGITGVYGSTGATGATGPQGSTGATGPQGTQGINGLQGATGVSGITGATGAIGATGPSYSGSSTTSLTIGTGSFSIATQAGLAFQVGQYVSLVYQSNPANAMFGQITYYNSTTMTIYVTATQGSGTYTAWYITPSGIQGPQGSTGVTGITGATGPLGPTGPQGITGITGPAGIQGPIGQTGPIGPSGPIGITGPSGPTGPLGQTGATGITGVTGPTGAGYYATSTTSATIATGSVSFSVQTGLAYAVGSYVRIISVLDSTKLMEGTVTNYGSGLMYVNVTYTQGTGTYSNWLISVAGILGSTGVSGPTGPTGVGQTGPTGPLGPTGPAGSVGQTGATGVGAYNQTLNTTSNVTFNNVTANGTLTTNSAAIINAGITGAVVGVYSQYGIAVGPNGSSINTWIDQSGNIYSQQFGSNTRTGILNFYAAGSPYTYAGMYYDNTNTRLMVGALSGGVAYRNVYVAPGATLNADTIVCSGSVSKGSGSFRIPHPVPAKSATNELVHSFIEGPYCDLIYRGTATLVSGQATVDLDNHFGMTEGTFAALCKNAQVFVTNQTDWSAVKGSVTNNVLTIICQDTSATSVINWMVIAERNDPHIINTEWTDENGRPILEPAIKTPVATAPETGTPINPPTTIP